VPRFKLWDQLFILINSLCCCLRADDLVKKLSRQATIWEKLNKRPPRLSAPSNKSPASTPKFEISAPGANARIYGTLFTDTELQCVAYNRPVTINYITKRTLHIRKLLTLHYSQKTTYNTLHTTESYLQYVFERGGSRNNVESLDEITS